MRISTKNKERLKLFACHLLFYPFALRYQLDRNRFAKLHVGCGTNRFDGWINADIDPRADMIVFLQKKLPFGSNSLEIIYSEHVLEHVSYARCVFFLKEAYRTLKPNGVIRISMPDLDYLIDSYQNNWKEMEWISWPEYSFIKTRAEMINIAFRWWGHQHLYNKEELARALREAGFTTFAFQEYGKSEFKDLIGLETRSDSKLIAEAIKK